MRERVSSRYQKNKESAFMNGEIVVKIATIIVALLIIVCLVLLIILLVGRNGPAMLKGNVIGLDKGVVEVDGEGDISEVTFTASNLLPGDSVTKTYTLKINDEDVQQLTFRAAIASDTPQFADHLYIQANVGEDKIPEYTGKVSDMTDNIVFDVEGDTMIFTVTVTLGTTAGNDCMNTAVSLDFFWGASSVE